MPRALRLFAVVLLALVAAGCATPDTPAASEDPKPQPELIYTLTRDFDGTQGAFTETFTLDEGHWLCVDALLEGDGEFELSLQPPELKPWIILERGGNRSASEMVPGMVGDYIVHIDPTGFVGRLTLVVTNDP